MVGIDPKCFPVQPACAFTKWLAKVYSIHLTMHCSLSPMKEQLWPLCGYSSVGFYVPEASPYDALRSTVTDRSIICPEEAEDHFGLGVGTRLQRQCVKKGARVDFVIVSGRTSDVIPLMPPAFPSHTWAFTAAWVLHGTQLDQRSPALALHNCLSLVLNSEFCKKYVMPSSQRLKNHFLESNLNSDCLFWEFK